MLVSPSLTPRPAMARVAVGLALVLGLSACNNIDRTTGERTLVGTGTGAAVGAVVGGLGSGTILGGLAIGAAAGAAGGFIGDQIERNVR